MADSLTRRNANQVVFGTFFSLTLFFFQKLDTFIIFTWCVYVLVGWDDIGYNFLVGEDGNVYEGRGWDTVGAHAAPHNTNSVGK